MTVLETVVIPFNYIPIIMEESGFEPPNPKERFYRPSRLTRLRYSSIKWRGTESNRRHTELQSVALPTELPSHCVWVTTIKLLMEDTGLEPVTLCL